MSLGSTAGARRTSALTGVRCGILPWATGTTRVLRNKLESRVVESATFHGMNLIRFRNRRTELVNNH